MARYIVKKGEHRQDGKVYNEGDVIETDLKLDELFRDKFIKEGSRQDVKSTPMPTAKRKVHLDEDEDTPTASEAEERKAKKVPQDEPARGGDGMVEDDTVEDDDDGDDEEAKPKKKAAPKDAKEVTKSFKVAVDNDFKVFHSKEKGYEVKDGDKTLNTKPIKNKAKVTKFLEEHLKGGQD